MTPFLEKHADKWVPEPNTGCYIWIGAVAGNTHRQPRPQVKEGGKHRYAARVVCEEAHGLMDGMFACHKKHCHNPLCVNDDHLYAGTHSENMMDVPELVRISSARIAGRAPMR